MQIQTVIEREMKILQRGFQLIKYTKELERFADQVKVAEEAKSDRRNDCEKLRHTLIEIGNKNQVAGVDLQRLFAYAAQELLVAPKTTRKRNIDPLIKDLINCQLMYKLLSCDTANVHAVDDAEGEGEREHRSKSQKTLEEVGRVIDDMYKCLETDDSLNRLSVTTSS